MSLNESVAFIDACALNRERCFNDGFDRVRGEMRRSLSAGLVQPLTGFGLTLMNFL